MVLDKKSIDDPSSEDIASVRWQRDRAWGIVRGYAEDIDAGRSAVANLVGILDALEYEVVQRGVWHSTPASLRANIARIRKQGNAWLDRTEPEPVGGDVDDKAGVSS